MQKQEGNPSDPLEHIRIRKSYKDWLRSKAKKGNKSMTLILHKAIDIARWYDKNKSRVRIDDKRRKP